MTASRLGLVILTAIALALGIVVALDRPPAAVPRSNRLLPGLELDQIVELQIVRGDATVTLVRGESGWSVDAPVAGPADPSAVADLLGALELASAERWVDGDIGRARVDVTAFERGGGRWHLAIGDDGPAGTVRAQGEAEGGRAALVEAWVARALDRSADDLRRRAVIAASPPTGIELHAGGVDLVASGVPLRAHLPSGTVRLAAERARALIDALATLRFVRFPEVPGTSGEPEILGTLHVLGGAAPVEVEDRGGCPGAPEERWLGGTVGAGCVEGAAWEAVLEAARAIVGAPEMAVDRSPIGAGAVGRIELLDGAVVEARGGGWTVTVEGVEREADGAAVAELIEALRAPGRVVGAPPRKARTIAVTQADGTRVELLFFDASLQRAGEPYAIEIAPEVKALVERGWRAVADRIVLAEEPTQLRRIAAGGTTVTMGDTFEDWSSPAGAVDLAAVGAIRELVAALEADELLPASTELAPGARVIELGFDPPPAAGAEAHTRRIVVEKPGKGGRCRARVEEQPVILTAEACAALLAPLLTR